MASLGLYETRPLVGPSRVQRGFDHEARCGVLRFVRTSKRSFKMFELSCRAGPGVVRECAWNDPSYCDFISVFHKEKAVADIKEHMKVIGKDGAHVGTVDRVEGTRIKLTKNDGGQHEYIDSQLVGAVEGDYVKLSVNSELVPKTSQ